MNSAWGKNWRMVNEVMWFSPGLLGTGSREHRGQVLGCSAASGVSRDPLAKLAGRKFLSGCFCGLRLSLKPLAWGDSEPEWAALKVRGLAKSTRGVFFSYSERRVCSVSSGCEKIEQKENQNTGTKDSSVHEVGVALGVREEGLWLNPSILSSYPTRPFNASSMPAWAARSIPHVPACQAGTAPGGRAAALAKAQGNSISLVTTCHVAFGPRAYVEKWKQKADSQSHQFLVFRSPWFKPAKVMGFV